MRSVVLRPIVRPLLVYAVPRLLESTYQHTKGYNEAPALRRVFAAALEGGGIVKAMRVPDGQRVSNSRLKPKGDISGNSTAHAPLLSGPAVPPAAALCLPKGSPLEIMHV